MEEFEGRRRGMLTTGEWCNLVSNMLHHVYKWLSGDSAREVILLRLKVSSQFIFICIIFPNADNCFGFLDLISTVRETKTCLKN